MKATKKILLKLAFVFFLAFKAFSLSAQESSPFELNLVKDSILLGSGTFLCATDFLLDDVIKFNQTDFDGNLLERSSVNAFDRIFMNAYSNPLDKLGTVLCGASLLIPAANLAVSSSEYLTIAVMYAQTILFAHGTKETLKILVNRPRPYMYFENYPVEEVQKGDWNNSFPSGHTTYAFAGASFASYVFSVYFKDSPIKWAVISGSVALATGTAICRIMSGNHFLSDVIAGALIGSASGILIPVLHQKFNSEQKGPSKMQISLNGAGLNFCKKF